VVNGGTIWDLADATGIAHYLEHMLFKGTSEMGTIDFEKEYFHLQKIDSLYEELGKTSDKATRDAIQIQINQENKMASDYAVANEFDRLIASIGGKGINAFTSHDMVMYHNTFPPHQFEKWSEIYAHRFINPVFRLFQSELETVYEEKNMYMDEPSYALINAFDKAFYKNHPYGQRDVLGEIEHLKNPSLKRMYEYYNTYYVPENMALILSGELKSETVKPIIEEKFGRWEPKPKPEREFIEESDFKGKEVIKGRYLPVKVGIAGYRTVQKGHTDEATLTVINNLLSNQSQTGLWDKLTLDNKLLMASMEADIQVEHGRTLLIFVPKVIGQSLKKAESLVMNELEKLKKGEFDDALLLNVKLNLDRRHQLSLESNFQKAYLMAEAFISNRSWEDVMELNDLIQQVSREDIIQKANEYFAENRLVLYSRTGFPKKKKLQKPPYEAVSPKGTESEYARNLKDMPELELNPSFVDIAKEVNYLPLKEHLHFYHTSNPVNEIFDFDISIQKGILKDNRLTALAEMLESAGTANKDRDAFKQALGNIGTSISFSASDLAFNIEMRGFESNLNESLQLLSELLSSAVFNETGKKKYLSEVKFDRRMEDKSLDGKSDMISDYMLFGDKSPYLTRLSIKEIKALTFEELEQSLESLLEHESVIAYVGNAELTSLQDQLSNTLLPLLKASKTGLKEDRPLKQHEESIVYFLNDKKALQTQIYCLVNAGSGRNKEDQFKINTFNEYFGNNMSGIVFQEIREYRSLAYATGARLSNGSIRGRNAYLIGMVGCQADKSVEAMSAFRDLLTELPRKEDRMDDIRKSLMQSAAYSKPYFRALPASVHNWKLMGYTGDPNAVYYEKYQDVGFEKIDEVFEKYIKDKNLAFSIAGRKKSIDPKQYEPFGRFVELNLDQVRKK
jgi:zinc protease